MDPNKRSFLPHGFSSQLFSQPGGLALEAFSCVSKFTGALLCWFSHGNLQRDLANYQWDSRCNSCDSSKHLQSFFCGHPNFSMFHFHYGSKDNIPGFFGNFSRSTIRHFVNEAERLHSCSVLPLAASLIPSFHNL